MGEEAVCLTLKTDEIMDDKSSREEVKRSIECVVDDDTETESPSKKLALECLNNGRASECVLDSMEVEISNNKPENESLNEVKPEKDSLDNGSSCTVEESSCSPKSVADATEAENLDKKPAIESLTEGNYCTVEESSCSAMSVADAAEVEFLDKKPTLETLNNENSCTVDSKCLNERGLNSIDLETLNDKPIKEDSSDESSNRVGLKRSHECIVDATEAENPNKKAAIGLVNIENSSPTEKNCWRVEFQCSDGCVVNAVEVETPNSKPAKESLADVNFSGVELTLSYKSVVDAIEVESSNKELAVDCLNSGNNSSIDENSCNVECLSRCVLNTIDVESPNRKPAKYCLFDENSSIAELKSSHESCMDDIEAENHKQNPAVESENSSRMESECLGEGFVDTSEVETINNKPAKESLNDENSVRVESKYFKEYIDAIEVETPDKRLAKELSTESRSEVLDLNVSPQENASSSQTVSSQPLEGLLRSRCGEITSSNAVDSSPDIADKEGHCINEFSPLSKSQVILEGPKDAKSTGVKRIVIKFTNPKNSSDGVSSRTFHPSYMEDDNDFPYSRSHEEPNMNHSDVKIYKKGMLEIYTRNVKKLLSTGVLEGAEVKYINQEKELRGIINGCGYLCGCALCNFSMILNVHEFEQHAGCKSKHPNVHIFLNNGKSIHSIVQELKTMPVSSLEGMLRVLVGPLSNEWSYLQWKESLETANFEKNVKKAEIDEEYHAEFPQSTTSFSCSSEDTEDSLASASRHMMQKFPVKYNLSTMQNISKGRKRVPKRLRSPSTSGDRLKKRDNDLHRLLFMPNGLPNGSELAYYVKGKKVLDGYKQGNGILCSCCDKEVSPSQFENHAGCSKKRQPYRHIFTSTGVSLHDVALSLANGQCLAVSNTGGMCKICGIGGHLIFCDSCDHAFHRACLEIQCNKESEWCCPYCNDKLGVGRKLASSESSGSARSIIIRLTRVVKAPATEIGGCVVCRAPDFSVLKFDDRTVIICDQCEKEYHVGCLRKRGLCDLKELPQGKWFCCEYCNRIHATLQNLNITGAKVLPASMSEKINRKLIEKGLITEVGDDVQWQLLSGKSAPLEHRSLLTRAVTIFRDCFDPIVEKSGRDLIPAMVYGKNVAGQEFGGMYCALLSVKSVVVSAGLLRIFGQEVAELPLVATTKESQGKGYFRALFTCIEKLLCFLNVRKLVLPAAEDAVSIWKKMGFNEMTHDQYQAYSKDFLVISFKGTLMLEKTVSRP